MVLGSDDVAAIIHPNHYIITVRMVIYTVWLLDVHLKFCLSIVGPLPQCEESPVCGNVPAMMEVSTVVRVVA